MKTIARENRQLNHDRPGQRYSIGHQSYDDKEQFLTAKIIISIFNLCMATFFGVAHGIVMKSFGKCTSHEVLREFYFFLKKR